MLPDSLISQVQQNLNVAAGEKSQITSYEPVSGGDINKAFRLRTPGGCFFLKFNHAERYPGMFQAEASGLTLLGKSGQIRVPEVLGSHETGQFSWLLLEFIMQGKPGSDFWESFGISLAQLHRCSSDFFGLDHNNYIGSLPQSNHFHTNWFDFFIEERLQKQIWMARNAYLIDKTLIKHFENLYKELPSVFPIEPPSLVHGDLWSGNFMCDENGKACLVDPAVYYGFREMDIAMSKLFGGFDPRFYEAYHQAFPMAPGWPTRLEICNLYPLLVHVNLFGSSYLGSVKAIVKRF